MLVHTLGPELGLGLGRAGAEVRVRLGLGCAITEVRPSAMSIKI